ncbi:MAG: endonuclease III [Spirochaetales bacterium]|nr:endonuclease III [Spirochaetales bacterium]
MKEKIGWARIFRLLDGALKEKLLPSVSLVAAENPDPYRILISTVISLRTKDEVTKKAADRLLSRAPDVEKLAALDQGVIEKLIYPAGFYKTKAKNLKKIAFILIRDHRSRIPADRDILLTLPGVGRKTANLVLNLGFGIQAVCVDTHVHRISNRTGWVKTKNPEETEKALMEILPRNYWIRINELLVILGQHICTPISPRCSICPITEACIRRGVRRSR